MAKKSQKPSAYRGEKESLPTSFLQVPGWVLIETVLTSIAALIVQEIIQKMKDALTAEGKSFTPTALDEWKPKLHDSVFTKLVNHGDWATDKAKVLAVAKDMAIIAAILSGSLSTVNKAHVHAAFRACKDHQTCPGNPGGGRWCDFDI